MSYSSEVRDLFHSNANKRGCPKPVWLRQACPVAPPRVSAAAPQQVPITKRTERTTLSRKHKRPRQRYIVDSAHPARLPLSERSGNGDPATPPSTKRTWTREPQFKYRSSIRPPRLPSAIRDPYARFVEINGRRTLKRRAEDTELDLVAAENGI